MSLTPTGSATTAAAYLSVAPMTGQTLVYPPAGRWQESTHLELTERHRVTNWTLVPTQLWRLLEYPELSRYDLSSLKIVGGGSAVWAPELLRRLAERIPNARPGLALGYGDRSWTPSDLLGQIAKEVQGYGGTAEAELAGGGLLKKGDFAWAGQP